MRRVALIAALALAGCSSPPPPVGLTASNAADVSNVVTRAIFFFQGRDLNPAWTPPYGTASSHAVDNAPVACELGGTYTVAGTESIDAAGVFQYKLMWTFDVCTYSESDGNVTLTGAVTQVETEAEGPPPANALISVVGTFTSSNLTVTGVAYGWNIGTYVTACVLQGDMSGGPQGATLNGTLCSVPFTE